LTLVKFIVNIRYWEIEFGLTSIIACGHQRKARCVQVLALG